MEKDYLKYIGEFLDESIEIKPVPTHLKPQIRKNNEIKAFVFDVYGTLLISQSGDIDESVLSAENLLKAFKIADIEITAAEQSMKSFLTDVLHEFKKLILDTHLTQRSSDIPYPEVDILKIWRDIILKNQEKELLKLNGEPCIKCFTFVFEILSNQISPMPGMKMVLETLAAKGYPLGIISNAQFYTPVVMNYFLHNIITDNEFVEPFDPRLTIFSYKYLRSKPDKYLFQVLLKNCMEKYNIAPHEIFFLGNDMFRDVYPAKLAGLEAALFAGDTKSLRLRNEKTELKSINPDYIITDLHQLLEIIA